MVKKLTISESDNENTDTESIIDEKEIPKPVKPKKVMSQKQLETLMKGREARKLKLEEQKLNKKIEASKLLLQEEHKQKLKKVVKKEPKEESDDEEVVIIEKQKKPKKKVKKIIIQESESSEEEEEEVIIPEKKMKSQKNRKSVTSEDTRNADAFALASGAARHRDDVKQLPDSKFDNKEPKKINSYKNYFV